MVTPRDDENILHETAVEQSVLDELERAGNIGHTAAAIATPASPGSSYVQAEVVALRTALAAILVVMRDNGMIAAA